MIVMDAGEMGSDGLPDQSEERLTNALRDITSSARQQLQAIKFSQLLEPPVVD